MTNLDESTLLVAGFHYPHHSKNSGYDGIVRYLPCTFADAGKFIFSQAAIGTQQRQLNMLVFEAYLRLIRNQYKLVHYIYPEQHFPFSFSKSESVKSVATFHLKTSYWAKEERSDYKSYRKFLISRMRKHFYSNLNGIITLSSSEVDGFKAIFPNAKVRFIPHGVFPKDEFVQFTYTPRKNLNIISIGENYRDFEIYKKVVSYAEKFKPTWRFHLVGVSQEIKNRFKEFKTVIAYPYLSEQEYFELFRSCQVHFLPLTFATANNALLEAHTLGIPTLVSDVVAVQDYSVSSTKVFRNDLDAIQFLNDFDEMPHSKFNEIREGVLKDASIFHWKTIANKMMEFYEELFV